MGYVAVIDKIEWLNKPAIPSSQYPYFVLRPFLHLLPGKYAEKVIITFRSCWRKEVCAAVLCSAKKWMWLSTIWSKKWLILLRKETGISFIAREIFYWHWLICFLSHLIFMLRSYNPTFFFFFHLRFPFEFHSMFLFIQREWEK